MSDNGSDEFMKKALENPEITDDYDTILSYDISQKKSFLIRALKKHVPVQKMLRSSAEVITDNFSTNIYTSDKAISVKKEPTFSDTVTKEQQFSTSDNKLDAEGEGAVSNKDTSIPTSSQTYSCDVCQKVFDKNNEVALHKCTVHTTLKSYNCKTCNKRFSDAYSLYRHKKVHMCEKICKDSALEKVLISDNKLDVVVQSSLSNENTVIPTETETFICNVCQKIFDKRHLLALHTCNVKSYKCESCSKTFSSSGNLTKHKHIHTVGEKPYQCNLCKRKFYDHSSLFKHNRVHTGEKPFSCDICNTGFTLRNNLRKHIKDIHINKKNSDRKNKSKIQKTHICNFCHRIFATKKHLFYHFRTHTGEKPHGCDSCGKKFSNRSDLTRHMRVHTGEKRFVCSICNSRFRESCSLKTHMKDIHMGNDAYVCDVCDETFSKKHTFVMHSRIHKGKKPHVCPSCRACFSREQDLRKHQLIHFDASVT